MGNQQWQGSYNYVVAERDRIAAERDIARREVANLRAVRDGLEAQLCRTGTILKAETFEPVSEAAQRMVAERDRIAAETKAACAADLLALQPCASCGKLTARRAIGFPDMPWCDDSEPRDVLEVLRCVAARWVPAAPGAPFRYCADCHAVILRGETECQRCHKPAPAPTTGDVLADLAAAWSPLPASGCDETAWLIEIGQAQGHVPPLWWRGQATGPDARGLNTREFWTENATEARKFTTKCEAEQTAAWLAPHARYAITEHVFVSKVPPASGKATCRLCQGTGRRTVYPETAHCPPYEVQCDHKQPASEAEPKVRLWETVKPWYPEGDTLPQPTDVPAQAAAGVPWKGPIAYRAWGYDAWAFFDATQDVKRSEAPWMILQSGTEQEAIAVCAALNRPPRTPGCGCLETLLAVLAELKGQATPGTTVMVPLHWIKKRLCAALPAPECGDADADK